jgi:amino acid transporter
MQNPVKQLRRNGFISLGIVTVLYILANIAYFAAIPKAQLREAKEIAASLFFTRVFGSGNAVRGLNFLIALSSFGNLIAVMLGSSRMVRECGRCVLFCCTGNFPFLFTSALLTTITLPPAFTYVPRRPPAIPSRPSP